MEPEPFVYPELVSVDEIQKIRQAKMEPLTSKEGQPKEQKKEEVKPALKEGKRKENSENEKDGRKETKAKKVRQEGKRKDEGTKEQKKVVREENGLKEDL